MKNELHEHYDQHYYSYQSGGVGSAKVVLNLLYELYHPLSVIDFGCGVGAWLTVAESLGSQKLIGLDGSWVNKENLLSKNIDFTTVDFEGEIEIVEKYDLCISLEVAEHISEIKAKDFIDTLCKASNVVLFSAAIKHQGGTNHINEQWQSYWIKLFESNGYECFDIFREAIWQNEAVNSCYRQNIFLFVNRTSESVSQNIQKIKVKPIAGMATSTSP